MRRKLLLISSLIAGLVLTAMLGPQVVYAIGTIQPQADFNGDWYGDLAVGVRYEAIETTNLAGAVNVLYGRSASGLDDPGNQFWYQGNNGLVDTAESQDAFGSALAMGDFDGDGYIDLATGVPMEGDCERIQTLSIMAEETKSGAKG